MNKNSSSLVSYFCFLLFSFYFISCSPNNVTEDNSLKKYFDENKVNGCFGLFDNGQNNFTIYNLQRFRDSAYLPASTYKIVNSLIGLQTGKATNEKMVIPWDSVVRAIPAWNKDLTMEEAFKVSAVPWYQELARRIGKDTMQHWLDTLGYASKYNKAVIKKIDTFWLDNSIKITSDEQMGLVKKLYFKQLPFQARAQEIVKNMMLQTSNSNYKLSYKTGWGNSENGNAIGWVAGWIEENEHPYFFVLNVEGPPDTDMVAVRMNILNGILKQLGFFEGKK
ncbi:MAG TPA: penicillin-binding transpeptidase domain-containing protein [Chitinophagaceae bacterium]|nr:penicillin-binding transpeptidase domain-containing protein [Chitinophagaceae bacterium]